MFQFTHPGKGATPRQALRQSRWSSFNSRTLGRVRPRPTAPNGLLRRFQFTHPGKGATPVDRGTSLDMLRFQFTHPGKGATEYKTACDELHGVSIHAPWEGCDWQLSLGRKVQVAFQFTHPGKGATSDKVTDHCISLSFNSRTLGRVRLLGVPCLPERVYVSIHAPWEGCDEGVELYACSYVEFQFTHPGKGATARYTSQQRRGEVSIHAPWEGCDGAV